MTEQTPELTPNIGWMVSLFLLSVGVAAIWRGLAGDDSQEIALGFGVIAFAVIYGFALVGRRWPTDLAAGIRAICRVALVGFLWLLGIALALGIPLAILYFLVRFVKWAWIN